MIKAGAKLTITRLPLHELRVHEHQRRFPEQLTRYLELLGENDTDDLGIIHVKPRHNGYEILDGHHRFCALIMSGRPDALCLVIDEATSPTPNLRKDGQ
jgi:hypothetical protein